MQLPCQQMYAVLQKNQTKAEAAYHKRTENMLLGFREGLNVLVCSMPEYMNHREERQEGSTCEERGGPGPLAESQHGAQMPAVARAWQQ